MKNQDEKSVLNSVLYMLQYGNASFYAQTLRTDDLYFHSAYMEVVKMDHLPGKLETKISGHKVKIKDLFDDGYGETLVRHLEKDDPEPKISVNGEQVSLRGFIEEVTGQHSGLPNIHGVQFKNKTYINSDLSLNSKVKTVMSSYAMTVAGNKGGILGRQDDNAGAPIFLLHSKSRPWLKPYVVNFKMSEKTPKIKPLETGLTTYKALSEEQWGILTAQEAIKYYNKPVEEIFDQNELDLLKADPAVDLHDEKLFKIVNDFADIRSNFTVDEVGKYKKQLKL